MFTSLALAATCCAQDAAVHRPSTLDRVTIYPGQAMVERVLEVSAESAGARTVLVGPLPLGAQASSFQTAVEEGDLVVQGLELRRRRGSALTGPERDALRAEWETLRGERRALETRMEGIAAGKRAVDALVAAIGRGSLGEAGLPATASEAVRFVREEMERLDGEQAGAEREAAALDARIADLEKRLNPSGDDEQQAQEARLSLFFERPGSAVVRLTYLVENAWWEPTYDVRVSPDLTGVQVGLVAQVRQRTGEDWSDARVFLSTSTPSIGLDPPELPWRYFRVFEPAADRVSSALRGLNADAGAAEESEAALAPRVSVHDYGLTQQFALPERKSISADGEWHRFLIREVPLEVRPERYVVPSLSDQAYLRAEVIQTGDAPLLPGSANVYFGPDFLGEVDFPLMRRGDRTTLPLGVDPNLSVDFEQMEDDRENPGRFSLSSTAHVNRSYRATLRLSAAARSRVTVLVEEVLPLSRDDRVRVRVEGLAPLPLSSPEDIEAREERGIYRWRIELAPGSSQIVRWGYELAFDEELTPILQER